jgi:carbonic anhydrase/acetyltransferase-like protein (isoleucine patch superfamily)
MLFARAQALRLGALGQLGRRCEVRPVGSLPSLAAIVTTRRLVVPAWAATLPAVIAATSAITSGPVPVAVVPLVSIISAASLPWTAGIVAIASHALLDDRLKVGARQQLQELAALGLLLRRDDREDADALDVVLALGAELIPDGSTGGENRPVEDAFGFAGPSGAPRPRPIAADRRQLDVDPRWHGSPRYPLATQLLQPPQRRSSDVRSPFYCRAVPIYALADQEPTIHESAYVHPDAVIIGSVTIGARSSIWPNAVLRGDEGEIRIGAGTSVQDGSVLHTTQMHPTTVGDDCVIGHIVHLEGCTIEDGALVGNGAIVLHRVIVRTGAVVAANAVVLNDTEVPPGALAVGAPAMIKPGKARAEDIAHAARSYVERAARFRQQLRRID